jgi:membrane protein YqaA with SNARE-associated domain
MALPRYLRIGAAVGYCMHYAETRKALYLLGILSALESAILPIPIDAAVVPMMVANKARVWLVALVAMATSVFGGILGYLIGLLTYESFGVWLIGLYGLETQFAEIRADFAIDLWAGALVLFLGAVSPIPFKLTCIAAGFVAYNFPLFVLICVVGRGLRFYGMAVVFYWFGPPLKGLLERNKGAFTMLVIVVVVGGFVGLKYII